MVSKERARRRKRKSKRGLFALGEVLWDGVYLFLLQGLQLFRLALPVVFHDHHGGVDFAHRQVCGCWKNDKLPCKIRPEWDGTLSHGGNGSGGRETETQTTDREIHNNMRNTPAVVTILFHVNLWRHMREPPNQSQSKCSRFGRLSVSILIWLRLVLSQYLVSGNQKL